MAWRVKLIIFIEEFRKSPVEMSVTLQWNLIVDKRFALRTLLDQEKYHCHEESIPKEEISAEKEPLLRGKLAELATQIIANSNSVLLDTYEPLERKRDWIALVKKKVIEAGDIVPIDARSRPGHKLLDHHMPHFWDVTNHKGKSVRGLFTQESVEKALITNICMHSTPYKSEIRRMLLMTGGLGNVTKYRAVTAKSIVKFYNAKKVLDPCIGWGGRMLGALAAGAEYVGCEPDPKTVGGLQGILGDLPEDVKGRATIIGEPAEVGLDSVKGMFDMVLTSPPYFNLEVYTGGDQSTGRHATWDAWVENWLKVIVLRGLALLREGGVSCWSVKNFKTDKAYPLADVVRDIHKKVGWDLVKTVVMKGSGRPGGGRIKDGKTTRGSEEETFCFRKAVGPV